MADPGDLTTLDAVKSWLDLATDTDDALLADLISAVSTGITTILGRPVLSQNINETRDGGGGRVLVLAVTPVLAITLLTIGGTIVPPAPDPLIPGYTNSATRITLRGYRFNHGIANIRVTYQAGYLTVPADLAHAATRLVALRYRERDRPGIASHSLMGEAANFQTQALPPDVADVLARYTKVTPL